jgi:hypothetical protein
MNRTIHKFSAGRQGSCTRLSSLVSLACSSGSAVIHGGTSTLRLMWWSDYLIVNTGSRDRSQAEAHPGTRFTPPPRRKITRPTNHSRALLGHSQTVNLESRFAWRKIGIGAGGEDGSHPAPRRSIEHGEAQSAWTRVARRRARARGVGYQPEHEHLSRCRAWELGRFLEAVNGVHPPLGPLLLDQVRPGRTSVEIKRSRPFEESA